jgi:hypothetical protein
MNNIEGHIQMKLLIDADTKTTTLDKQYAHVNDEDGQNHEKSSDLIHQDNKRKRQCHPQYV